MKRYKFSPVTISREEYDDYIKARFLVQHILQRIQLDLDGELVPITSISTKTIEEYFPTEVEKIRRMKNEEIS